MIKIGLYTAIKAKIYDERRPPKILCKSE